MREKEKEGENEGVINVREGEKVKEKKWTKM